MGVQTIARDATEQPAPTASLSPRSDQASGTEAAKRWDAITAAIGVCDELSVLFEQADREREMASYNVAGQARTLMWRTPAPDHAALAWKLQQAIYYELGVEQQDHPLRYVLRDLIALAPGPETAAPDREPPQAGPSGAELLADHERLQSWLKSAPDGLADKLVDPLYDQLWEIEGRIFHGEPTTLADLRAQLGLLFKIYEAAGPDAGHIPYDVIVNVLRGGCKVLGEGAA